MKTRKRGRRLKCPVVLAAILVFLLAAGCGGAVTTEPGKAGAPRSQDGDTGPFRFIVCGDPQNNYEVFGRIVDAARSVDFLIIAGDVTGSGTGTEFTNFLNFMKNSGVEYHCVPGNHDVATSPVDGNYAKYLGRPNRSFDHKNSHFLLIDNSTPALGFYESQREWVKNDLKKSRGRFEHVFAVCHVPPTYPYALSSDETQETGMKANRELIPVLSSGGVEELFCGHYHGYRQYREDEVTVTITGGAGAPLFSSSDYHHYILVEVNGGKKHQKVVRI